MVTMAMMRLGMKKSLTPLFEVIDFMLRPVITCLLSVPQNFVSTSSGLASAKPVWPFRAKTGSPAQVLPQGALRDWGQQGLHQDNFWGTSSRQGKSYLTALSQHFYWIKVGTSTRLLQNINLILL